MNTLIFQELGKMVKMRRPAWKCILEDSTVRVLTMQFIVEWQIIRDMEKLGYEVKEVLLHQQFGCVITLVNNKGI